MVSPLDRKLFRDLWRIKGQAIAIGAVISVGVLMLVMMTGLVASLDQTRIAYYERYRLADIFAPVARAPQRLEDRLAAIPGVDAAEGRVTGSALIDIAGRDLPVQAQAVSLPDFGSPTLNDIYLTAGRKLDANHPDEILLLESFAKANELKPGDTLRATMNGARRTFRIVGLAQSPEFLYTAAPGEFASDDSKFGVIWMNRTALAAAYDMKGAFNQVLLSLGRGASLPAVLDAVDRLLDPYGGVGAFGIADLTSNRFITEEIGGLRSMSVALPPIFLGVAAFLLTIVISRMVQAEREEIGLMKAFGYTDLEVGWHYFKLILTIAVGGALTGCLMGIAAGRAMADFYLTYFKFPFLIFRLEPGPFVAGFLISVLSASAGGLVVLRGVFSLTPAAAMRPPAPADYSGAGRIGQWLNPVLDQPTRMVLRRLTRQPGRMAGAMIGIAAGMGLSVAMFTLLDSFDTMTEQTFSVSDRSDVTVTFADAKSDHTIFELRSIPGVIEVQPVREVPAILRNGLETHRGAITGLPENPRLDRAMAADQTPIAMRREGVILTTALARILGIAPGDTLTVEVREGRRPVLQLPVVAVAESLLGSPSYMEIDALNRALREPNRVSGAYLRIDGAQARQIYAALKDMPSVAGVSLKSEARTSFEAMMNQSAGAMRYIMVLVAAIITFGVVYNAARIAQAERARDLASLRVLGFTRGEAAFVLLGELAAVTLAAVPVGGLIGYYLGFAVSAAFSTDLYTVRADFSPASYGTAALTVILSALFSGWVVKRDIDRADLVAALKTRE